MKKFIVIISTLIILYFIFDLCFYRLGFFINFNYNDITYNVKQEGKKILLKNNNKFEEFEIKGIDMGVGIPGHFATEYAIEKEDYLRWFKYIQEMGANTIRVYTILGTEFYDAVYEYNINNENPLYIIHGLWVNDYVQNSHVDAYDDIFVGQILDDSKDLVDVIHGRKKLSLGRGLGTGTYNKDISKWVIGYILGVEWEDVTVEFTNMSHKDLNSYQGKYIQTTDEASPFETMLAIVGDRIIEYETKKYNHQTLVAFSNWATTDPFDYNDAITKYFKKIAKVDVEHLKFTNEVKTGTFASYHIYPYYPDYYRLDEKYKDSTNTYRDYLTNINNYHTIPVIISEFGVSTGRGMAQRERNNNRNQGFMSEQDQGEAIVSMYNDIMDAGCAGSVIFTWQDEWFKRTWNTMHAIDLTKTPYWSDYQTNEQYFGLLSFDPGEKESISYVDGDTKEWKEKDKVSVNKDLSLSMKYDEKFIYFKVKRKNNEKIYIPLDITPKSGSNTMDNLKFNKDVDFVIVIDGEENSRVLVQEYYDCFKAMFSNEIYTKNIYSKENKPKKNSNKFNKINLVLQMQTEIVYEINKILPEIYETGKLLHGNANPTSKEFNSLADFNINGDEIEIKIPWQLLNFSNPSEMVIHDDYYKNYGVENLKIDSINVGIGSDNINNIKLNKVEMNGWKNKVTYHERLKKSYYIVKELWADK